MASEYRNYPDFPKRSLPVRSWPNFSRLMLRITLYADCEHEVYSIITDSLNMNSLITDSVNLNSLIC